MTVDGKRTAAKDAPKKASAAILFLAVLTACGGATTAPPATTAALSDAPSGQAAVATTARAGATQTGSSLTFPTAKPPTRDLITVLGKADFVGVVRVSRVTGRYGTQGTAGAEAIWSDVEFVAEGVVKDDHGLARAGTFTVPFLGGQVGERAMQVDHFPTFAVGQEAIVIMKSDERPCPTYGGEYGILPIKNGRVYTSYGHLVTAITDQGYEVATPQELMPTAPMPKSLMAGAGGRAMQPASSVDHTAIDVADAMSQLQALVEAGR